jgi:FAD/FMN-containing dehydrogenase
VTLADVVAPEALVEPKGRYLADLMGRGVVGTADAVVLPSTTEEVAAVMRWCYETDTPLTARGGGTGLAGGAIPVEGGVVLGFERLNRVRRFDPLLWRMHVEAGVTTGDVHRLARESGLRFPPDPGAAEISQIGGNIACNAGGPHAFKYGVTGNWVTGVEAVVPPGVIIRAGGPIRKDVAGYDVKSLLIGSEGTLGVITAAWLRLVPAPELELPVIGLYGDADAGISAIERVLASGVVPAAIEYLDAVTLSYSGGAYPFGLPEGGAFMVITEADGAADEARRVAAELRTALEEDAVAVRATSRNSGAGVRASRSRSSRSAAARSARTSQCRSTGSATWHARRSRSAPGTTSRRCRSATPATATSTPHSCSRPTRPRRRRRPMPRATSCSSSRSASAAR